MSFEQPDTTSLNYLTTTCDGTTPWVASVWVHDTTTRHFIAYSSNASLMQKTTGMFQVSDRTNMRDFTCTATSGWTHFNVEKASDGTVSAWQDGTSLAGTGYLNASWNGSVTCFRGGATCFDFRVMDGTYDSSAWSYYRNDILTGGDRVLPA